MANDEVLYELGTDINSDFVFEDGDLKLISYDENLVQAIVNRLNTDLDELDLYYEDYGSVIGYYIGWKGNDETVSFIKSEIDIVLGREVRLYDWDSEVTYDGDGVISIHLTLRPNPDYTIETDLTVDENGVEVVENGD